MSCWTFYQLLEGIGAISKADSKKAVLHPDFTMDDIEDDPDQDMDPEDLHSSHEIIPAVDKASELFPLPLP